MIIIYTMPIHLYNSLSRLKEEFVPLKPPAVNIYTCGVTVYDDCHIGHARSLYTFDVIKRYLEYRGFKVTFVRNITDIDDKIINRANELKTAWKDLIKKYIESYYEDMRALSIEKADYEPRATENIPEMIGYIKSLIEKGYAYATETGVYFNVRKFKEYGKLSGQSMDQMFCGVRKSPDETKEDPLDFALWKSSKPDEPFWESPWGNGRPGWHIECSVMSQKFLKTETLDIHAGGRDLVFPHHENEITQAEALTGKPFAKYWMHHGLLTINGQKMSKSLGNFVTIKDFLNKYRNPDLLKLFFLSAHYSHPIDYTESKIDEAKQALERILILMDKIEKKAPQNKPQSAGQKNREIENLKQRFIEAMDDDFNMPQGLAAVFELVNATNKHIDDAGFIVSAHTVLKELLGIFSIRLEQPAVSAKGAVGGSLPQPGVIADKDVQEKIAEREQARKDRKFARADEIRKELEQAGVILEDSKEGTAWRRKL